MPFVSVPRSRVRANPKMIVMEDPASPTVQDPEGPSQVEIAPDEAAPAPVRADAVVNSYPTEVDVSDVREPDAFDLHSGADPIRGGAGPAPASEPAAQ